MPLHAPGDFKELILAYGGPGSGKTTAWMSIADLSLKTKSDAHFWVIDNDNSTVKAITTPTGTFHNLTANTTIWRPKSFDEYEEINKTILGSAKSNDWIIVDMLSNVWEGMPDWWHQNVYGDSPWDYWKAVRKEILEGDKDRSFGGDSGVDWQYIGKVYRAWEKALTINPPCNFFGTSSESEIQARFDKTGEQAAKYAVAGGWAPKVEKGVAHRLDVVLRFRKTTESQGRKKTYIRKITMVKDHDREHIWEDVIGGTTLELSDPPKFGLDVLRKVWGWELGAVR